MGRKAATIDTLGGIELHHGSDTWRVKVEINRVTTRGPQRDSESEAQADLERVWEQARPHAKVDLDLGRKMFLEALANLHQAGVASTTAASSSVLQLAALSTTTRQADLCSGLVTLCRGPPPGGGPAFP